MSIDNATFIVQRGEDHFSCLGKDLKDTLVEGDLLIAQRGDEQRSWPAPSPWEGAIGIFHVIVNDPADIRLTNPEHIYNLDTEDEVSSIDAAGEWIIVAGPECTDLFRSSGGNWDFGPLTDTSRVQDMSNMFYGASKFNSDLSMFDTSGVTAMPYTFYGTKSFNQDISGWDVSKVTTMGRLFADTDAFNQDISSWNVKNVLNMTEMFTRSKAFNQDLSLWCVSKIDTTPVRFSYGATAWTESQPIWGTCPRGEDS